MSSGFWKRASASLVAGALAAVLAAPLSGQAFGTSEVSRLTPPPAPEQIGPAACLVLGSGGLTGAGLRSVGLSQVTSFGSGGFYGPYYNPAFTANGYGTVSGFLSFTGGQPSPLAVTLGSALCQGLGLTAPAPSGGPFVLRDWGLVPPPVLGFPGAGLGLFGFGFPGGLGFPGLTGTVRVGF